MSTEREAVLHLTKALLSVIDALGKVKQDAIEPGSGLLLTNFHQSLKNASSEIEAVLRAMERR